jgi:SAM-dependent methyltransferase
MGLESKVSEYFEVLREEKIYRRSGNLRFFLRYFFGPIDFTGLDVLEVGGGSGWISFYAGCMGARRVDCLEPECAGSSTDITDLFLRIQSRLRLDSVKLIRNGVLDFAPEGRTYDLIFMNNSINHLDEEACKRLHVDDRSRERYRAIMRKLSGLARRGATLIASDCSRYNLFAMLNLKNAVVPSIEWTKHQPPGVWVALLSEAGFSSPRIRWNSFNSLRWPGRVLLGNRVMSFCLASEFCLTMRKA